MIDVPASATPQVARAITTARTLIAGAPPADVDAIGAHSLRRGFITSADMAGATLPKLFGV